MRAALGLEPVPVDDLREIGLGDWEGLTLETVRAQDGDRYGRWLEAPWTTRLRAASRCRALAERVRARSSGSAPASRRPRARRLARRGDRERPLRVARRPLNAIWSLRLDNASITRVVLPAGQLLALNETGHLAGVARETVAP